MSMMPYQPPPPPAPSNASNYYNQPPPPQHHQIQHYQPGQMVHEEEKKHGKFGKIGSQVSSLMCTLIISWATLPSMVLDSDLALRPRATWSIAVRPPFLNVGVTADMQSFKRLPCRMLFNGQYDTLSTFNP
jgi:hypothetical protein